MTYHIASVSWGKDSLAMLLMLIARKWPIDEVVFFDTGMDFDAVYDVRDQTLQLLRDYGIKYTELRPKDPMWWSMFARPVKKRGTDIVHKHGYGWCGGPCRWGTTEKQRAAIAMPKSEMRRYISALQQMNKIVSLRHLSPTKNIRLPA